MWSDKPMVSWMADGNISAGAADAFVVKSNSDETGQ